LAVDHLAILRDRDVDAERALSIDQFDGLSVVSGLFPAVFHGLEAQASPVHTRVLRTLFRRHLANLEASLIRDPGNETAPAWGEAGAHFLRRPGNR
jgi:hypothetical protein